MKTRPKQQRNESLNKVEAHNIVGFIDANLFLLKAATIEGSVSEKIPGKFECMP